MTEPNTEDPRVPELPVQFAGREIYVKLPSPEQLLVWQRTVKQLQGADVGSFTGAQALKALDRARRIIDTVLANDSDKEWLDDEFLDGSLGLRDAGALITLTVEAYADAAEAEGNRETRRAAKKVAPKKAVRKKATR
jgi:hypothetical protein